MAKMEKKRYYRDDRRRMEREGSDMIKEDMNAIANLPQNVMMKKYPEQPYSYYDLNDDAKGIEVQMRDDVKKEQRKRGQKYPEKY